MDLLQYLKRRRGGKNLKNGVLVARKVNSKVLVGWSLCKLSVDKFNPQRGLDIATGRINSHLVDKRESGDVPPSIEDKVEKFVERCKRYFRVKKVKVV